MVNFKIVYFAFVMFQYLICLVLSASCCHSLHSTAPIGKVTLSLHVCLILNSLTLSVYFCSIRSGFNPSAFQWKGEGVVAGSCEGGGTDTAAGGAQAGSGGYCQGTAATGPLTCCSGTRQTEAWTYGMFRYSLLQDCMQSLRALEKRDRTVRSCRHIKSSAWVSSMYCVWRPYCVQL